MAHRTTTYVLSREWHDLLSIYIFRLHPLPHCSETVGYSYMTTYLDERDVPGECGEEAPAWELAQYAIFILIVSDSCLPHRAYASESDPLLTMSVYHFPVSHRSAGRNSGSVALPTLPAPLAAHHWAGPVHRRHVCRVGDRRRGRADGDRVGLPWKRRLGCEGGWLKPSSRSEWRRSALPSRRGVEP